MKTIKNSTEASAMRFKRVYIEVSNRCNLNCSFCVPLKRKAGIMSAEQFNYIVQQIKPHTSFIYFHVKGEPLLHPDLEKLLDISYFNGLRVNITTNGTLLGKKSELLLSHRAVRQVNISLHAYNEIIGINGDKYLEEAISFAQLANDKNIYVVMRLWNLDKDGNTDQKSLEIMNRIETAFNWDSPLVEEMGGKKSVKISHHAFVGWEHEFEWPSLEHEFVSDEGFCYGMRHQIAILVDGTVVPCCLDSNGEAKLGNIFSESFGEIISTKRAKGIKHGFENRVCYDELCKRCSFRTKFD